jgi:hypothetical protein
LDDVENILIVEMRAREARRDEIVVRQLVDRGRMPTVFVTLEALGSAVVHAKFVKGTVEDDPETQMH